MKLHPPRSENDSIVDGSEIVHALNPGSSMGPIASLSGRPLLARSGHSHPRLIPGTLLAGGIKGAERDRGPRFCFGLPRWRTFGCAGLRGEGSTPVPLPPPMTPPPAFLRQ